MSSRPPPPPPIHPRSNAQDPPALAMAATQLPRPTPPGPYALPPASLLASPYPRMQPATYLHTFPSPQPQRHQSDHTAQFPPPYPTAVSQYLQPTSPTSAARGSWSAAAPLDRLLQTESYAPPYSSYTTSPRTYSQFPSQAITNQEPARKKLSSGSPVDHPARQEQPDFSRRYSSKDEFRSTVPPTTSPSYSTYRSPENSRYTSRTSSSSYGVVPGSNAQPESAPMTASIPPNSSSRYKLTMRQQPVAARACGFGERDRRVIDPPPIVQLSLTDFDPTSAADVAALRQQFNVVHCALFSVPHQSSALATGADVTAIPDPNTGRLNRRLMGSLVANAFIAIDPEAPPSNNENARLGSFFIFHDLSCRQNGLYKLHFTLMCLDVTAIPTHAQSNRAASVESNVFEVFSAKDFPGMKSSTLLTRELKRQGANVSVKKGNEGKSGRKPKKRDSVDTDDSASEASEGGAVAAQQSRKKRKE